MFLIPIHTHYVQYYASIIYAPLPTHVHVDIVVNIHVSLPIVSCVLAPIVLVSAQELHIHKVSCIAIRISTFVLHISTSITSTSYHRLKYTIPHGSFSSYKIAVFSATCFFRCYTPNVLWFHCETHSSGRLDNTLRMFKCSCICKTLSSTLMALLMRVSPSGHLAANFISLIPSLSC